MADWPKPKLGLAETRDNTSWVDRASVAPNIKRNHCRTIQIPTRRTESLSAFDGLAWSDRHIPQP